VRSPIAQSLSLSIALLIVTTSYAQDDSQWQKDRELAQQQVANLPSLAPANLADVLKFGIEQNDLVIRTRLTPTNGPSQINLNDLPGLCSVIVSGTQPVRAHDLYTPKIFTFLRYDFVRTNGFESITTVMMTPMNLQVARDTESRTEIRNISIIQANSSMQNEPRVTLRVAIQSLVSDQLSMKVDRSAADFVTLRRLYPGDTAKYLGPIFQDLRADADVFGIDSKLAWQVLAADAQADPKVTANVQRIVARLDSDDFHDRESAAGDLEKLGQSAAISLAHFDRTGLSAEQNSRLDAFLSPYHPVSDEDAGRLSNDVNFLVDCLYVTDDFVVNSSLRRLGKITGRQLTFDASLRSDARREAIAKLRDQVAQAPTTGPATRASGVSVQPRNDN
jgi:hypothetical protein